MRRHVLTVVAALAAAGCSLPPGPADVPLGPRETSMTGASGRVSAAVPFTISTHCGIDEAHFQGRFYEAVEPLSDGQGNPPDGWDNPTQSGTMRLLSSTEAEFRDTAGHVVLFRVRPQATAFKNRCA